LIFAILWLGCADDARTPLTFSVTTEHGSCDGVDDASVPITALRLKQPANLAQRLRPPGVAWAHPGHDPSGAVTGEMLTAFDYVPCGEPLEVDAGQGYTGELETAELDLRGSARFRGQSGGLPIDLSLEVDHAVTGIPIVGELTDRATVRVRFDPTTVLAVMPPDDDGDGTLTITDAGVSNALVYALSNPNHWTIHLE